MCPDEYAKDAEEGGDHDGDGSAAILERPSANTCEREIVRRGEGAMEQGPWPAALWFEGGDELAIGVDVAELFAGAIFKDAADPDGEFHAVDVAPEAGAVVGVAVSDLWAGAVELFQAVLFVVLEDLISAADHVAAGVIVRLWGYEQEPRRDKAGPSGDHVCVLSSVQRQVELKRPRNRELHCDIWNSAETRSVHRP